MSSLPSNEKRGNAPQFWNYFVLLFEIIGIVLTITELLEFIQGKSTTLSYPLLIGASLLLFSGLVWIGFAPRSSAIYSPVKTKPIPRYPKLYKWARFLLAVFFFVAVFVAFVLLLIIADIFYIDRKAVQTVLTSSFIRHALWMSIWTSITTVFLSLIFAIPIGFILSRYRFRGRLLVDTVVDLPIIFPPLVAGLTLLVFFSQTVFGRWIQEDLGIEFVFQPKGIVLCQFLVSASFAIRSAKTAFDDVDRRYENVALTLGCSQWGSF